MQFKVELPTTESAACFALIGAVASAIIGGNSGLAQNLVLALVTSKKVGGQETNRALTALSKLTDEVAKRLVATGRTEHDEETQGAGDVLLDWALESE